MVLQKITNSGGSAAIADISTSGGSSASATDEGIKIIGSDGTTYRIIKVNSDGELLVNIEDVDINTADTVRTATTTVIAVQTIDADGEVLDYTKIANIETAVQTLADGMYVDNSAFTDGTDFGMAVLGVNSNATVSAGATSTLRITNDGHLILAGYNSVADNISMAEESPLNLQYQVEKREFTNITTNTTDYVYIDMTGYRGVTIQGETSGTAPTDTLTVTFEGSAQDDGTAAPSCFYDDITTDLAGVGSYVDSDFTVMVDTSIALKYVRVKIVTSNDAGNDADLNLFIKKMY